MKDNMAMKKLAARTSPRKQARTASVAPQPDFITSEAALDEALKRLAAADPRNIGHMLEVAGPPPLRKRMEGLAGLTWIIVSQQVSTASARAIYSRVEQRFGELHHAMFLTATDDDLRACGLSAPKMRTLRHVAAAIDEGRLDFAELPLLDADAARERMTAIKGIGPWTSDIYLLFCLGHPDVWPAGDLALQEGVRIALRLRQRPDAKRLEKLSQRWRPWRAAAARLVWAYYAKSLALRREAIPPG
jgi:DNA-3-methyladenine glycosylase II